MPRKPIANRSAGFTIVETMLVVAVAGMIMLITIMAIPALQRSSHNNSRRQDVQAILDAVSHYKLNNSGCMPNGCGGNFLKYTKLVSYSKNVAYLDGDSGTPVTDGINVHSELPSTTAASDSNTNPDAVEVYNYRKCSTNPQGNSTNRGAGFGDVVALYAVELGSGYSEEDSLHVIHYSKGTQPQCQQM